MSRLTLETMLTVACLALGGALFWYVISHQDARDALKEVCAFVRQSVEHAEGIQHGDDLPQGVEDAAHACFKEGLLPKLPEPKRVKSMVICPFAAPCWKDGRPIRGAL